MSNKKCLKRLKIHNSFLIKTAQFEGEDEFPVIKREDAVPNKIITFSKALKTKDYNQWVCFYEDDFKFLRLWNNPKKYIKILKKFNGIISPDFSIFWDMPLEWQRFYCFMGRCLAYWFIENGIKVIPNIRYESRKSKSFFTLGVEPYGTIAIGTVGCIKNSVKRNSLIEGLSLAIAILKPHTIIVYGSAPNSVFQKYINQNIRIIAFEGETNKYYKKNNK